MVRPDESRAAKEGVDMQDLSRLALYFGRSAAGSSVSTVDRSMKICHWVSQISNESLNSSKSNRGGEPYGLNAFGVGAIFERSGTFGLRSSVLLVGTVTFASSVGIEVKEKNIDYDGREMWFCTFFKSPQTKHASVQ